ncbi:MAG: DUF3325 domain-containing protein [Pseudomonadota bacterium]
MSQVALACAAFSAALGGFTALSLAMERHFQDSFGRNRTPGRWVPWLRAAGMCGLVVSLLVCLAVQGATQGWVLWLGVMTAAAIAVVNVLSFAPRWSVRIGLLGAAACLLALVASWVS